MYNKEPFSLAIVATLVSIALLIFLLRVYTRTRLLRFFGIDDCLILVSMLCTIGTLSVSIMLARLGLWGQKDAILVDTMVTIRRYIWAFSLMAVVGISFTKLSIALFLLRIARRRQYRQCLFAMIIILITLTIIWFSSVLFQCTPVAAAWDHDQRYQAHCMSRLTYRNLGLINGSLNIATNCIFALSLVSMISKSHIKLNDTICLISILILGLVSCAAAIVRVPTIYMWKDDNALAHGAWFCSWSIIEMSTGITAACLPTLKSLLTTITNFFSDLTSSRQSRDTSKPEPVIDSRPSSPYAMSYSTPTFLSLPRPKPTRFHDHTSELDFDLFESPSHRSRTHSRNPSNLTMFSNFTMPTTVTGECEVMRPRTCSKGLTELGEEMRGFKSGYAVSVTSGSGETCEGSEDGKNIKRMASDEDVGNGEDGKNGDAVVGGIMRTTEVRVS